MKKTIVIKELREKDKEVVRRLLVESYKQFEVEYTNPIIWTEYLADIISSVDNPRVEKILVAESDQTIIGSLQIFQSSDHAYERPELKIVAPIIRLLAVHPCARGQGVAQELVKAGVDYARSIGAPNIYLHTSDKMQKAIRLYEWLGFKRDQAKEFTKGDFLVKCYRFDL